MLYTFTFAGDKIFYVVLGEKMYTAILKETRKSLRLTFHFPFKSPEIVFSIDL